MQVAAEVHDARVPEAQEVLRREARRGLVVDAQRAHPLDRAADPDERFVERTEPDDLRGCQRDAHRDDRVHALPHEEVLEDLPALLGIGGEAVEGQVVVGLDERLLDPLEQVREEPAVDERHDDAHVLRPAGDEARCARGDDVADLRRRLGDAGARGGGDVAAAAERARRGGLGDPGEPGDVGDGAHRAPSIGTRGASSRRTRALEAVPGCAGAESDDGPSAARAPRPTPRGRPFRYLSDLAVTRELPYVDLWNRFPMGKKTPARRRRLTRRRTHDRTAGRTRIHSMKRRRTWATPYSDVASRHPSQRSASPASRSRDARATSRPRTPRTPTARRTRRTARSTGAPRSASAAPSRTTRPTASSSRGRTSSPARASP